MKLLRASCPCGYVTRKARSGRHHDQWRFPVFDTNAATLTDVLTALPEHDRKRINQLQFDIYTQMPRDRTSRRDASAKMQALDDDICKAFFEQSMTALRDQYATNTTSVFDPPLKTVFLCPRCNRNTLTLNQVSVIAFCKSDCGHEYEWPDSETSGCPKCGHRPHRFQTEYEAEFAALPRTNCGCGCSSSIDCVSHMDCYCPKCGSPPDAFEKGGEHFCGRHHERMVAYRAPRDFLFIETASRWVANRFPNAKLWGEAAAGEKAIFSSYCASCERDHQRWLQSHNLEDG